MMTGDAYNRVLGAVRELGLKIGHQQRQAVAQCPAHDDGNPSLAIRPIEGAVLVYCHAGCDVDAVLDALKLTRADLYDEGQATYRYDDGRTVHRTYKGNSKRFRQSGNTGGTPTLYHLQRLLDATEGAVFVVEGEKDVHAIESAGGIATTAPMGSANFGKVDVEPLRGRYVTAVVDRDAAGEKWAQAVAEKLSGVVAGLRFAHAVTGKDAADHIAAGHGLEDFEPVEIRLPQHDQVEVTEVKPRPVVHRMSTVKPEQIDYLWPGYIALGKLHDVSGDPGLGKSTMTLDLASRVTTGKPWPDAAPGCPPGAVLLVSAEDGLADTIRPRLDAAGADVDRVLALTGVRLPDGDERMPALPLDIARIGDVMGEHGVKLVIIDPLMAYLGSDVNSHRDQDVRRALAPLARLAEEHRAAVVFVRHLNKGNGSALYRGGGSIGVIAAARFGYTVGRDPDDDRRRVMASTKANLAIEPAALAFELLDAAGCARVEWHGPVAHSADDLVRGEDDGRAELTGAAESFILAYLDKRGGFAPASDVLDAGRQAGFSERTLQRARKRAGAGTRKVAMGGAWEWTRSEDATKAPLAPTHRDKAPMAPMASRVAPMRRCRVCAEPLDPSLGAAITHPLCEPPELDGAS